MPRRTDKEVQKEPQARNSKYGLRPLAPEEEKRRKVAEQRRQREAAQKARKAELARKMSNVEKPGSSSAAPAKDGDGNDSRAEEPVSTPTPLVQPPVDPVNTVAPADVTPATPQLDEVSGLVTDLTKDTDEDHPPPYTPDTINSNALRTCKGGDDGKDPEEPKGPEEPEG